ncbi:unnamed protein product [Coffea canephora]|uniref:RING-type domain-containing protein n=1 Tax=Coffea canephora TaxID=49390 RepID=A0A068UFN2_COFCA|nr:unnamed protein product [Coffea canephora]
MSLTLPVCSLPDWLVNSILGLDDDAYFQDQPQHLDHHQLVDQSIINQEKDCEIPQSMACSESLASELAKQRLEMDWLLQLENQRLRTVVQEKGRQQAVLLQRYESKIVNLMHQKEKDLEIARNRTMELQNLLIRAEVEAHEWQRKAMDNEAMVIGLNNRLEVVRALDVESVCESSNGECRNREDQELRKLACKLCKARRLSIVFLPCRHLCSCTTCESLLEVCPTCESVKDSSIEIFLD